MITIDARPDENGVYRITTLPAPPPPPKPDLFTQDKAALYRDIRWYGTRAAFVPTAGPDGTNPFIKLSNMA